MKKLFLLLSISTFSIAFSQSKDLTKKQALEAFKNSELRAKTDLKISEFEKIYKTALCVKKNYADKEYFPLALKLETMPIFQKKITNDQLKEPNGCAPSSEFCIYGIGLYLLTGSTEEEIKEMKTEKNCFF